jgi:amino acid adenylation domain-containing protein
VLEAQSNQDLPFERLVEEVQPERSLAHSPLFQVTFALDRPGSGGALSLGGLAIEPFGGGGDGVSKYDLDLSFVETDAAMGGTLVYRAALFDPETVARMAGHLETVLEAMAADPSRRLSEVPLLRGAEREQVLEGWSAAAPPAWPGFIHELVAAQAERTPGAAAVVFQGETLTYAALEAGANRLAHHLRRLGVGPETRVGVCAERSPELVVALLGTMRSGGAYVPLDPSYPSERLSYMLRDAGVQVLLTQERLLERLPRMEADLVCLDRDRERIAAESADPPSAPSDPDGLAYVIYTSGSTGAPKGVQVSHRGLAHSTAARFARYPEPVRGFLLLSSVSFDSSVAGIFWTLCSGGSLHLPPNDAWHDPVRLVEIAARGRVSHVLCVPSLYAALLDEAERRPGWDPAVAIVAGEECPRGLVERHFGLLPGTALYNEYGPTEGTVWCTVHACRADDASRLVPIGRPVPGTRVYVLDAAGGPAPAGVVGEVHVGGGGVARGYLGRPELTAEKFVPDPFSPQPGARLYRTGDRARWRPDGELEFLGRFDAQVKVRGFRIEPGEIEAALRGHPAVREAAVLAREDAPGQRRLVAYGVVEEGAEVRVPELRTYLAARLPEHMVPAAFVVMETLPLTPNGKVDRRALPAPEAGGEAEYVPPRTVVEELLCGIWSEVLGVERVGVEDDFFALGGHSMLATRVAFRVQQTFGVEVPLRDLFETPTVAALALSVEDSMLLGLDDAAVEEGLMELGGVSER